MTSWETECLKYRGKILRGPDSHWCNSWDGLPVSAFTVEYDCCEEKKTFVGRICNYFYMAYWNYLDRRRLRKEGEGDF